MKNGSLKLAISDSCQNHEVVSDGPHNISVERLKPPGNCCSLIREIVEIEHPWL